MEISSARVYISKDVVFDENIFPFANLHSNAGALLRKEILLLPQHLLGDVNCADPEATNSLHSDDEHDTQ